MPYYTSAVLTAAEIQFIRLSVQRVYGDDILKQSLQTAMHL